MTSIPIHAHADEHDLEDLEEETLDGTGHEESADEEERPGPRIDQGIEEEDEEEDAAAFALEEVEDDEEETAPLAAGEQAPRERGGERTGDDRSPSRPWPQWTPSQRTGRRRDAVSPLRRRTCPSSRTCSSRARRSWSRSPRSRSPKRVRASPRTSRYRAASWYLCRRLAMSASSRKIASDEERQRLKRILISEKGDSSGGFIVRTAAEGASEEELRADLRFLISLWTEIKQRSETAKAPALIYHDLNLVERILRDQVSSNFSTIWGRYGAGVRADRPLPEPLSSRRWCAGSSSTPRKRRSSSILASRKRSQRALKSKVWLKSGGSIVINQTEALVAIDINTGKYVGGRRLAWKTRS